MRPICVCLILWRQELRRGTKRAICDDFVMPGQGRAQGTRPEPEPGDPGGARTPFAPPRTDYVGLFAVTAGIGLDEVVKGFEAAHDDFRAIMAKILADRLAEAFAEWLHWKVRTRIWGYSSDEELSLDGMLRERYRGIRPAPATRPVPTTAKKQRFSMCWGPRSWPAFI
jgi:cobalamin-dependent methionine synthase I